PIISARESRCDTLMGFAQARSTHPTATALRTGERAFDRFERRLGLGAVGSAGLRHIRAPAATFAAERLGALAHQVDGGEARREVGGDADHDAGLAFLGDADNGDDARAEALLAFVGEAAQVLEVDAFDRARQKLHIADHAHAIRALRAPPAHG